MGSPRLFVSKKLEHRDDLVECRLIHITACFGIGKTELAFEVTSIRYIDVCKQRPGFVVRAQTTAGRTFPSKLDIRVFHTSSYTIVGIKPLIHLST